MANQALIDLSLSAKVRDCNTAALCAEAGAGDDDIPLQQSQGSRQIPISVVARGYQSSAINPKQPIDVLVVGNASLTSGQLTAVSGVSVNAFLTSGSIKIATVRCNFEHLVAIDALTNVTGYNLSSLMRPQLNVAIPQSNVASAWGGVPPGPYSKYSGRDVIIGVIDSGLYLQHGDFKYATGESRVLKAWDMTIAGSGPVGVANYGTEYSQAALNAEALKEYPVFSNILVDTIGHGTPMASIACGNGSEIGADPYRYKYVGVAPQADIITVKLPDFPSEANIIDAVNYVFNRAGAYSPRRRAVALVTAMMNKGPHDGTAALDLALTALTGQDKLLVAPAGNFGWALSNPQYPGYGELGVVTHAITTMPTVGATVKTLVADVSSAANGAQPMNEFLLFEGWFAGDQQYSIGVRGKGGSPLVTVGPVTAANGQDVTGVLTIAGNVSGFRNTTVRIKNNTQTNPTGTKKKIEVYLYNDPTQTNIPLTSLMIDVTRTGGADTAGVVHWFLADAVRSNRSKLWDACVFNPLASLWTATASGDNTIMSPGSADGAICAGSWLDRARFESSDGTITQPPGIVVADVGKPSWFTSNGPRVGDSDFRPDVLAPGEYVVAALSDQQNPQPSSAFIADTYWHVGVGGMRIGGTSCAAAFVAGALALLLQKYGTLSVAQARATLRTLVIADSKTGACPNNTAGYGRLNLVTMGNVVGVGPLPPPGGSPGAGNPSQDDPPIKRAGSAYDPTPKTLDPETGETATSVSLFNSIDDSPQADDLVVMEVYDPTGALVRSLERSYTTDGKAAFSWDLMAGGHRVAAGDYLVRFRYGAKASVRKVTVT